MRTDRLCDMFSSIQVGIFDVGIIALGSVIG